MPPPIITPLPTPPTRTSPANFSERADHFLSALPNFGNQMNSLADYMNTASVGSIAAAESARDLALQYRDESRSARDTALQHRNDAQAARSGAETAQGLAETAQGLAEDAVALANGMPIGTIMHFSADTPPAGWLVCNGTAVTTLYPDLRQFLLDAGSPYGVSGADPLLPDLRGEFVRGWDGGRGVDVGRTFGSAQGGAVQDHSHLSGAASLSATANNLAAVGRFGTVPRVGASVTRDAGGGGTGGATAAMAITSGVVKSDVVTPPAANLQPSNYAPVSQADVAAETRPRNVALLPCIRAYASVVNVPGQADLDNIAAEYVSRAQDTALSAGYTSSSRDLGAISGGTVPLSPTGGNFITYTNTGAHTLQAPVMAGDYTLVIAVEDGVGAGAITLSGFDRVIGDAFGAVAGNAYNVYVTKLGTRILANVVRIV